MKEYTEQEVRNLRNQVYGHHISDEEWETCKQNWMKPDQIKWLEGQTKLPIA